MGNGKQKNKFPVIILIVNQEKNKNTVKKKMYLYVDASSIFDKTNLILTF